MFINKELGFLLKLFGNVNFFTGGGGVQIRQGGINPLAKVDPRGSIFAGGFGPGRSKSTRTPSLFNKNNGFGSERINARLVFTRANKLLSE